MHLLDHGLYVVSYFISFAFPLVCNRIFSIQQLPTEFKEDYANLWMSIIRSNEKEIEKNAQKLGVGELYGHFACMVAGRTWNAIMGGIEKQKKTLTEQEEIKDDASRYLVCRNFPYAVHNYYSYIHVLLNPGGDCRSASSSTTRNVVDL